MRTLTLSAALLGCLAVPISGQGIWTNPQFPGGGSHIVKAKVTDDFTMVVYANKCVGFYELEQSGQLTLRGFGGEEEVIQNLLRELRKETLIPAAPGGAAALPIPTKLVFKYCPIAGGTQTVVTDCNGYSALRCAQFHKKQIDAMFTIFPPKRNASGAVISPVTASTHPGPSPSQSRLPETPPARRQ